LSEKAREKLVQMNLVGTVFASHFPAAQLHWMIADKSENIVVESMAAFPTKLSPAMQTPFSLQAS